MKNYDYQKTVVVCSGEHYGEGWPPENFVEFLAWAHARMLEIPEEYRHRAIIEIDSDSDYGNSCTATLEIYYTRPPTAEEVEARKKADRQRKNDQLARAKEQYLHLKAQFEPDGDE